MDLDSSSCSPRSSPKVGERRNIGEDLDAGTELGPKRIKMRDLESVLYIEGTKTHNSECRKAKETMDELCSTDGNGKSKNVEHPESVHSYEQQPSIGGPATSPPSISAACLSLGLVGSSHSPVSKSCVASSTQKSDAVKPTFLEGIDGERNISVKSSRGFDLDLNATDHAGVEYNPFHPYKKLGHTIPTDPSECGSTTGPLEESESLRKWKEMKQNGFLSSSHGGIPSAPKQHGRQSKKRKEDEPKRKVDATKGETASRFTRIAAPSGLLSGLNPGIINHVRNRKQVHSIIEAIVRSETSDEQIHNESQKRNEEVDRKANRFNVPSSIFSFSVPECSIGTSGLDMAEGKYHHGSVSSHLTSGSEHDNLTLKLSSAGTMASENASCMSSGYISGSQDNVSALSFEAATVASQWLQLLYQDVRGRLAALRRSRKRVRNVIQKELPYLLSAELSSTQDKKPCLWQSIDAGSSNQGTSFMHVRKWKSLFSQMDKSLSEEGKHLERVLDQVKGMQMQCEKGLKSVNEDCLPLMGSSHEARLKQEEALQGEFAVRAAAASIYSTCNLLMTSENVPCF
ncbi:hypothetical protein Taro_018322 [Colocasia esculenta]|uniref:Uncharacterized protein n=1 Tax=Colocasia esculenta TaxID=4460 RepID=A0A843UQP4_COLES|nr:hypothetical protein [Colocasia esculenta]